MNAPLPSPPPGERLLITGLLALGFHALVILGVSFTFPEPQPTPAPPTLEVTLVHTESEEAPEEADYLAQAHQRGGGTTRERVRESAPLSVPSPDTSAGTAANTRAAAQPEPARAAPRPVLTREDSRRQTRSDEPSPEAPVRAPATAAELIQRSLEIARLTARAEDAWQSYSRRPDPRFLTSNTRRAADAAYLQAWTQKVERIGNLNYPDEARRRGLSGSLILEVTLRPDGALRSVRLLESSGEPVLDDAALAIVRLAAPFAPVPPEVLGEHNELRIVRTWVFSARNRLHSR